MVNISIDFGKIADFPSVQEASAALSDGRFSSHFNALISDLDYGVTSISIVSYNPKAGEDVSKVSWVSWPTRSGLTIGVNMNYDYSKAITSGGGYFSHELNHHTKEMNEISRAAFDTYLTSTRGTTHFAQTKGSLTTGTNASKTARATEAMIYGFEEVLAQIKDNDYRRMEGKILADLGALTPISYKDFISSAKEGKLTKEVIESFVHHYDKYVKSYLSYNAIRAHVISNMNPDQISYEIAYQSGISFRDDGAVDFWVDEQGNIGRTGSGTYYSSDFINTYGVVSQNGTAIGIAQATLGAHFRGLADLLGFDGYFGIQGSFAKPGEGKPAERGSLCCDPRCSSG